MTGTQSRPPADIERRLRAFALDHALVLGLALVPGVVAWATGRPAASAALGVVATSLPLAGLLGALAGVSGRTPGRWLAGTELLDASAQGVTGALRGALRAVLLVAIGWTTAGFGWLVLALTAALDPWRRGWHDRLMGTLTVVAGRTSALGVGRVLGDGSTTGRDQVVNLTAARLGTGSAPAVPLPRSGRRTPVVPLPRRWQVEFDGGESFVVEQRLLIGRATAPAGGGSLSQEPGWARLDSPRGTLSAVHAELAVRPDGALVLVDRDSTNGSELVRAGVSRPLAPRRPATLLPGDRVRFGDRWMQVAPETARNGVAPPGATS